MAIDPVVTHVVSTVSAIEPLSASFYFVFNVAMASLVVFCVWFFICKYLLRKQDKIYYAVLNSYPNEVSLTVEQRIFVLGMQRSVLGRGSPSERLFIFSLLGLAVLCLIILSPLMLFRM